jgi:hypothetical protein
VGGTLIGSVGEVCIASKMARMQWQCLKWNEKPMQFYLGLGAFPLSEWETLRMDRAGLVKAFGNEKTKKLSNSSVIFSGSGRSSWGQAFAVAQEVS